MGQCLDPAPRVLRTAHFTLPVVPMIAAANLWLVFSTPGVGPIAQIGSHLRADAAVQGNRFQRLPSGAERTMRGRQPGQARNPTRPGFTI